MDAGTARLLAHLGFEALATTSARLRVFTWPTRQHSGRDQMMAHVAVIASATDLPSADLRMVSATGPIASPRLSEWQQPQDLSVASIEDMGNHPIGPFTHSSRPSSAFALRLPFRVHSFEFTLTARCENYLVGRPDLADTIKRLQAYQEAGADVLRSWPTKDEIATLVRSVDRPVNVVMGLQGVRLSLAELSALGVKRVSVGGSLCRAALGAFLRAANEMREHGTFNYADHAISHRELSAMFGA